MSAAAVSVLGWLAEYLTLPSSAHDVSDVIVVHGGDSGERVLAASNLFLAGRGRVILLEGYDSAMRAMRDYVGRWQTERLLDSGIARSAIRYDVGAETTYGEAMNARRFLERHGWSSALIVSNPQHMRRLAHVYGRVFGGTTLRYALVAAPADDWRPEKWWASGRSLLSVTKECVKYLWYLVRY